jgi:hypothetical protein
MSSMKLPRGLGLSVALLSLATAACGVGSLQGVGGAGGAPATGGAGGSSGSGGSGGAAPAIGGGGGSGGGGNESGMLMGQCAPPMGAGGGGHSTGAAGAPGGGTGGAAVADGGMRSGCDGVPQRMPIKNNSMAGAASSDGRIYLFAGWAPNNGQPYCEPPLLEYDPARDSYRKLASGPFAIFAAPTLAFAHGKLITLENRLGLYDPVTDTWSEGAPPPIILMNRAATVGPDGRVYFLGGSGNGTNVDYSHRADLYDPVTDHWSSLPDLPFQSQGDAAVTVGGRIYLVGREAAVFDPTSQRWSQLPSPPTPR